MNTKCDFYVMGHDGSMEWIGSSFKNGDINEIDLKILVQGDKTLFEEAVIDFVKENNGFIKEDINGIWPWFWSDSRMTDYTYMFHVCTGRVLVCESGGRVMDPIKLLQGMDKIGADVGMGIVVFPKMIVEKEIVEVFPSNPGVDINDELAEGC